MYKFTILLFIINPKWSKWVLANNIQLSSFYKHFIQRFYKKQALVVTIHFQHN